MASTHDSSGDKPILQPQAPIYKRLLCTLAVAALQNIMAAGYGYKRLTAGLDKVPTLVKTYPARPRLPVRIFFPKTYDRTAAAAAPRQTLPLLFSIHGGGWVVGDPADNDPFNLHFSETHAALVVALNYAKAPGNAFPGPRRDLEAQIAAVLADPELAPHIDPARVAIVGFSAGGNLAMTVCEVPAVRERITAGIVPIYPVTDLSVPVELKLHTRRYKAKLGGSRARTTDPLGAVAGIFFNWAYIAAGQDLCDPALSPFFAKRSDLPKRMWIIGCELDMLGHEAWRTACKFAGKPVPGLEERIGQEEPADGGKLGTLIKSGNEAFAFDVKDEDGEVKWLCVPDAGHAFEAADAMGGDEDETKDGKMKMDVLSKDIGEWLFG